MSNGVRTAIIGAGRIGALHAANLAAGTTPLELAAVVEPSPSKEFVAWSASHGVPLLGKVQDVLDDGDVAAVLICTPTDTHVDLIERASGRKKHIFCEKPVSSDIASARRAVETASAAGVTLQIGFNRRFDHNFAALRRAVLDGSVGAVEIVRVTSRDPGPPPVEYVRRSGGLFMDMTIHDFDMVRFLTGQEVEEVFARGASLVDPEIGRAGDIDTAVISIRFDGGALGIIENSRRAEYGYDQRAEIHGSRGAAVTANDAENTLVVSTSGGVVAQKPLHFFLERYRASFVSELAAFAEAVTSGRPAAVTGADGVAAMQIARACALSLADGRPVKVSEI